MTESNLTVNSRSYDGTLRKSWQVARVNDSDDPLIVKGVFDLEIHHPNLGVIRPGTISYEYFWPDRWYNVFRFHEPDGTFRYFYCNVCMPPEIGRSVIDYVDLDVDIVADAEGRLMILDEDEFRENAVSQKYPELIHTKTSQAISELRSLIDRSEFPFDPHEQMKHYEDS